MYLYIVECVIRKGGLSRRKENPLKIGVASNLERRLKQLQNGNPFRLCYMLVIKIDSRKEAFDKEKEYHRIFRRERMLGEWFKPRILRSYRIDELFLKCQEQWDKKIIPDYSKYGFVTQGYSKNNEHL